MIPFDEFKINNQLKSAIEDLGFTTATPIQEQAFPVIASGKDVVGISQIGTGITLTYLSATAGVEDFYGRVLDFDNY